MPRLLSALAVCLLVSAGSVARTSAQCAEPSFAAARSYAVGSSISTGDAQSVAAADFNGDGLTDLITANASSRSVSVLLGAAAGGFAPAINTGTGTTRPRAVAATDFNEDGKADAAVTSQNSADVFVLLGDGAGGFAAPAQVALGQNPLALLAADFDGDGHADLAVTLPGENLLMLLKGTGAGTFTSAQLFPTGSIPYALAAADFDTDGRLDLAVANSGANTVSLLLNDGAGGFAAHAVVVTGTNPRHVAAADLNGDGKTDMAVANYGAASVSLHAGRGDGTFAAPLNFSTGSPPDSVAVGDFNNDGTADLAAGYTAGGVSVRLGPFAVDIGFAAGVGAARRFDLASGPVFVAVDDFSGDGSDDIAALGYGANAVSLLVGDGAGNFLNAHRLADQNGRSDITTGGSGGLALLLNTCGDTPPVSLSVGDAAVTEGDAGNADAVFQVTLSAPSAQAVTVNYRASGGSAAAGADFQPVSGTLTFAPGETSRAVAVPVAGDLSNEFDEHFRLSLYNPSGARIADRRGLGSITDADDDPSISISDVSAPEGDANSTAFVFNVTLSAPSGKTVIVGANNSDGTATGSDYFYYAGPYDLVFAPGETAKTVTISSRPDFDIEPDETFFIDLRVPRNATLADAQGTGTIIDDDFTPTVSLSINDVSVVEGNSGETGAVFTVSLSGQTTKTVTVDYFASSGAGTDHVGTSGTLTFAPGETTKTLTVQVTGDTVVEPNEQFEVRLVNQRNALMGDAVGILTILNDDGGAALISVGDVTVTEGDSGTKEATFTLTLSAPTQQQVSFQFTTAPGTAQDGEDYFAVSGGSLFAPGLTTQTITAPVRGDTIAEPSETFFLRLSNVSGAVVADGEGQATILDNDGGGASASSFQFDAHFYEVSEAGGEATVTVTRSGDLSAAASVNYATERSNNVLSASDRSDYTLALGTLRFAPGEAAKSFKVLITDDLYEEGNSFGDEAIDVRLSAPAGGAALGTPSFALITIVDNDKTSRPSPVRDATFDPAFFVRQHYADFLNRQPDDSGLAFWTGQLTECEQRPELERQPCREVRRINVSASFFLSIEFQETGFLVHRTFGAAFGTTRVGGNVPLTLREFLPDTQEVSRGVVIGQPGAAQLLEQNKVAYFDNFVRRAQFTAAYPLSVSAAAFVDALNANTSGSLSQGERDALVADLTAGARTRAQVLRAVAEDSDFTAREKNRAFVLTQYFGYLRRNPNDAPEQNLNFDGYNFWLGKLNEFGGNFVNAEMIKAFITSGEYEQRFGL